MRLSFLAHDLGYSMGLTFGSQMIICFAHQVVCAYDFFFNMKSGGSIVAFNAFISIVTGILIFLQCNSAHNVSDEVSWNVL